MGQKCGMRYDEQQITRLLREMTPKSKFYKLVKSELKRIGRWKNRPRGNSAR